MSSAASPKNNENRTVRKEFRKGSLQEEKKKNPKWEKVHTSISDMSEFEKTEAMMKENIAKK